MPFFNEKQLEESIIALLQEQGYEHVKGEAIERDLDEVVLRDDLRTYLRNRYSSDGITDTEVEAAIRVIVQKQGLSLYEENRHTMSLLMDGFSLKREDASKQTSTSTPSPTTRRTARSNSAARPCCPSPKAMWRRSPPMVRAAKVATVAVTVVPVAKAVTVASAAAVATAVAAADNPANQ